ncbi:hypothetical protein, partial [Rhodococcus sp. BS-15]
AIHNIQRAQNVGSVHHIVPAAELRPQLVSAVERGMARSRNRGRFPDRPTPDRRPRRKRELVP